MVFHHAHKTVSTFYIKLFCFFLGWTIDRELHSLSCCFQLNSFSQYFFFWWMKGASFFLFFFFSFLFSTFHIFLFLFFAFLFPERGITHLTLLSPEVVLRMIILIERKKSEMENAVHNKYSRFFFFPFLFFFLPWYFFVYFTTTKAIITSPLLFFKL